MLFAAGASSEILLELGAVLLVLAIVGRLAGRIGLPAIPLYLVAGLVIGDGGLIELDQSVEFIRIGADLGVVLLLLLLGLEYTPEDLQSGLRSNWLAGVVDLVSSAAPGVSVALLLGWDTTGAVLLGGITYISSSGIIAKLLGDFERLGNRETPVILSVLVIEDLVMALYLPVLAAMLIGDTVGEAALSTSVAVVVVAFAMMVSARYGTTVTRIIDSRSNELLLLTVLGVTFLVAGMAEEAKVSAAVGAFLLGVALSGRVAEEGRELLLPVRDLFAGFFFVYFGIQVDPNSLPSMLIPAAILALITAGTKFGTGWWAAKRMGVASKGRIRAGASLVPRGEFSIVIAGLGVAAGVHQDLGPLAACYVLILAIGGSLMMRYADTIKRPPPRVKRRQIA